MNLQITRPLALAGVHHVDSTPEFRGHGELRGVYTVLPHTNPDPEDVLIPDGPVDAAWCTVAEPDVKRTVES
jgi:hypothetical protein